MTTVTEPPRGRPTMRDDPVRKALEAAVAAYQARTGGDPEYDDTVNIAPAIAAFLRALPAQIAVQDSRGRWVSGAMTGWHTLVAAAVERAAREDKP